MNTLKGFTIVELLIAIVVIAILAAISIVAYNGVQQRAKKFSAYDCRQSMV
ncbi:prepilin-type N-terminal cleavage/methylation domain-containing protein [Candidatus Saccharibacteria bacterium]|nr:prepilin-type N-terminal cleavage/methylation domain-containing protein [Candidatus Saccharibacteria bacterium]